MDGVPISMLHILLTVRWKYSRSFKKPSSSLSFIEQSYIKRIMSIDDVTPVPAHDLAGDLAYDEKDEKDEIAMVKASAAETQDVQGDAAFYDSVTAAPINPRSKTAFQLYLILLIAALNATASGFDGVSDLIILRSLAVPLRRLFGHRGSHKPRV
jgi:hypothetical protein